jgi:hypothetical protein
LFGRDVLSSPWWRGSPNIFASGNALMEESGVVMALPGVGDVGHPEACPVSAHL